MLPQVPLYSVRQTVTPEAVSPGGVEPIPADVDPCEVAVLTTSPLLNIKSEQHDLWSVSSVSMVQSNPDQYGEAADQYSLTVILGCDS